MLENSWTEIVDYIMFLQLITKICFLYVTALINHYDIINLTLTSVLYTLINTFYNKVMFSKQDVCLEVGKDVAVLRFQYYIVPLESSFNQ